MGAKATYVYCAVQARRKPSFRHLPAGPPGLGKHRLLDASRDLWLVVADAPLSRYGEAPIRRGLQDMKWLSRCAVGHEAVVEYCLRACGRADEALHDLRETTFRAHQRNRTPAARDRRVDEARGRTPGWGVRIRAVPQPRARQAAGKPAGGAATGTWPYWLRRNRSATKRARWRPALRPE
jgi:hypothetical protein